MDRSTMGSVTLKRDAVASKGDWSGHLTDVRDDSVIFEVRKVPGYDVASEEFYEWPNLTSLP